MIVVKDLHKSFGDVKAVRGVSFEAHDGEITGLLGPNGAGKTTTLRMLYSLLPPDRGEILIDGLNPTRDAMEIKRTLGVVPDNRGLYSRLTARENISYYGELHGLSRQRMAQRISELVETLDMAFPPTSCRKWPPCVTASSSSPGARSQPTAARRNCSPEAAAIHWKTPSCG